MLDASAKTEKQLRHLSVVNLSRMGHGAPSIMQTLLDVDESKADRLVKMTAGLPGGTGNTATSAAV